MSHFLQCRPLVKFIKLSVLRLVFFCLDVQQVFNTNYHESCSSRIKSYGFYMSAKKRTTIKNKLQVNLILGFNPKFPTCSIAAFSTFFRVETCQSFKKTTGL